MYFVVFKTLDMMNR